MADTDAERAAKAARARKQLKKHQERKRDSMVIKDGPPIFASTAPAASTNTSNSIEESPPASVLFADSTPSATDALFGETFSTVDSLFNSNAPPPTTHMDNGHASSRTSIPGPKHASSLFETGNNNFNGNVDAFSVDDPLSAAGLYSTPGPKVGTEPPFVADLYSDPGSKPATEPPSPFADPNSNPSSSAHANSFEPADVHPTSDAYPPTSPPPAAAIYPAATPRASTDTISTGDTEELRSQLRSQQSALSLLVSEKSTLSDRVAKLEATLERASNGEHEAKEGREKLAALHQRIQQLDADVAQSFAKLASSEKDAKEATERVADLEREYEAAKRLEAELRNTLSERETRIATLETQVSDTTQTDEVHLLQRSLQSSEDRASSLEAELARRSQGLSAATADKERLTSELENMQKRHSDATIQATESDRRADEKTNLNERLGVELDTIRSTVELLTKERDQHRKHAEENTTEIDRLQREAEKQNEALTDARSDANGAHRRAAAAEKRIDGLQSENERLVSTLNEVNARIGSLTQDKATLDEEKGALERKIREAQHVASDGSERSRERIHELEQALDASKRELSSKLAESEHQIETLSTKLQDCERKLEQTTVTANTHASELESSRSGASSYTAQIASLQQQLEEIQQNHSNLQTGRDNTAAEQTKLRTQLHETKEAYENVKGDVVRLQAELDNARILSESSQVKTNEKSSAENGSEPLPSAASGSSSASPAPIVDNKTTFDKPYVENLTHHHDLELSKVRSEIRKLEASIFEESGRAHKADRRAAELQEEIAKIRAGATTRPQSLAIRSPSSPLSPPSPSFESRSDTNTLLANRAHRRSATAAHFPALSPLSERGETSFHPTAEQPRGNASMVPPSTSPRSPRSMAMPREELRLAPAQRHRRRESLQMLRARIGDDMFEQVYNGNTDGATVDAATTRNGAPKTHLSPPTVSLLPPSPEKQTDNTVLDALRSPSKRTGLVSAADARRTLRPVRTRPQFANEELLYCAHCRDDLIIV